MSTDPRHVRTKSTPRRLFAALAVLAAWATLAAPGAAWGQSSLDGGDLVVVSRTYGTAYGPVALEPGVPTPVISGRDTGDEALPPIGSGPEATAPGSHLSVLALDAGTLLVNPSTPVGLLLVDVATGDRSEAPGTSGPPWAGGGDMLNLPDGRVLIISDDFGAGPLGIGRLLRYDPATGETEIVSGGDDPTAIVGDGPILYRPRTLALLDEQTALVGEFGVGLPGLLLFSIDLETGDRTVLSSIDIVPALRYVATDGVRGMTPEPIEARGAGPRTNQTSRGLVVADGRIFLGASFEDDGFAPALLEIDPVTGDRTLLAGQASEGGTPVSVPFGPGSTDRLPDAPTSFRSTDDASFVMCASFGPNLIWRYDLATNTLTELADLDPGVLPDFRGDLRLSGLAIVPEACEADLDGDGELTIFDFLAFQNLFDAGDPIADFDADGRLTLFDFLAFQNAFDAGCP